MPQRLITVSLGMVSLRDFSKYYSRASTLLVSYSFSGESEKIWGHIHHDCPHISEPLYVWQPQVGRDVV